MDLPHLQPTLARLTLALLLATALAGCADEPADDEIQLGDSVVTDPTDYSYATGSGVNQSHKHDYWNGQDELTIIDLAGGMSFTLNGGTYGTGVLRPDDGVVVPQGTAKVVIDVEMEDDHAVQDHGEPEVWIQTPAMSTAVYLGQVADSPLEYETTLDDADLPHQVLSAWEVWLRIPNGEVLAPVGLRSFDMSFEITMTAHNGLDLPLFPPHPDFWADGDKLTLVEGRTGGTLLWAQNPPGCGYCSGGIYVVDADDGALVPPGTLEVHVSLDYEWTTPTGLALIYHGADSRNWKDAPLESDDGNTLEYIIPIDQDTDGPYSKQSLWQFYFKFDDTVEGNGPYNGAWQLSADAVKDPEWDV